MSTIGVAEYVNSAYLQFGRYVNANRHIVNIFDGLKPVYKRLILTAINTKGMTKTIALAADTVKNLHPHGTDALINPISRLVRAGIFDGQGNHGFHKITGEYLSEAAPRYTSAGLNDRFRRMFSKLLKHVPTHENDYGHTEQDYLPVPIPFALILGSEGIGIGTNARIPGFTADSLFEAFVADDFTKLKSSYGQSIDYSHPNMRHVWEGGKGSIKYRYKVYYSNGKSYIEGNPELFALDLRSVFEWKRASKATVLDESDSVQRLSVCKESRMRYPTGTDIHNHLEKIAQQVIPYYIRVNYNNCIYTIGIRDWIKITYENYLNLLQRYREDEIKKLTYEMLVFSNFRKVADLIINKPDLSYDQIAKSVSIDVSVVREISSKSINTLRTLDADKRCANISDQLVNIKKFDSKKEVEDIISSFKKE